LAVGSPKVEVVSPTPVLQESRAAPAETAGDAPPTQPIRDHEFVTKTYVRESVCDVCRDVLTGLAQQVSLRPRRLPIGPQMAEFPRVPGP
jgi:hypothetical protein